MSSPPNPYESPAAGPPSPYATSTNQTPVFLAVGSLVTAVLGMSSCLPLVGCCFMPLPVVSLGLGIFALAQKPEQGPKMMAIIGITLAVLTLLAWAAMLIIGLVATSMDQSTVPSPINQ